MRVELSDRLDLPAQVCENSRQLGPVEVGPYVSFTAWPPRWAPLLPSEATFHSLPHCPYPPGLSLALVPLVISQFCPELECVYRFLSPEAHG